MLQGGRTFGPLGRSDLFYATLCRSQVKHPCLRNRKTLGGWHSRPLQTAQTREELFEDKVLFGLYVLCGKATTPLQNDSER